MSNISTFVLQKTATTATVSSNNSSMYCNGILFASVNLCCIQLGTYCEGGHLISNASNVLWIVAPRCAEVSSVFTGISAAVTTAQQVSGCTGWFIPTLSQLQMGYANRTYWDSYSTPPGGYWSSTENDATTAWTVCFATGGSIACVKTINDKVRAFRCVTY
jgi:hypothetical protein